MRRLLVTALLFGCGTTKDPTPAGAASVPGPAQVAADPAPPASNVVLTIREPGVLEVAPNGTALSMGAVVEQEKDGRWTDLAPSEPYRLLESCSIDDLPLCTASDHTLQIVPWTAMTCGSQCSPDCRKAVPYGRGPFRFVVKACDGSHPLVSPAFDMDDRHWAAQSTTKAVVARVDQPPKWDAASGPSATTIAGMTVKGAEQALDDDARKALAAALDDPKGFDDVLQRRCPMGTKVGFRLTRTLPTTGSETKEQTNDIVIDFTCQKLFVVRGDKLPRHVHASHFDPSRPAFVAIAKRYFPEVK